MILNENREIVGAFERVVFPDFGDVAVIAKVDTGAWNGAIHATNITEVGAALEFDFLGEKSLRARAAEFKKTLVTHAGGEKHKRYVVPLTLEIAGRRHRAFVGLSDRQNLSRRMILGRRFLLENRILVDVSENHDYSLERPKQRRAQ